MTGRIYGIMTLMPTVINRPLVCATLADQSHSYQATLITVFDRLVEEVKIPKINRIDEVQHARPARNPHVFEEQWSSTVT